MCNHISIKRMTPAEVVIRKAINFIAVVKVFANLASFCIPANYSSPVFFRQPLTALNPFHQSILIGMTIIFAVSPVGDFTVATAAFAFPFSSNVTSCHFGLNSFAHFSTSAR